MNNVQFSLSFNQETNNLNNNFDDFCRQYYSKMSMGGYSYSLSMFDPNTKCIFNNEQFDNPYNLLLKIASQGVHRFNYHNVNASCLATNNGILVNSTSLLNPISFNGFSGVPTRISETFNIKTINGKSYICDYILKNIN